MFLLRFVGRCYGYSTEIYGGGVGSPTPSIAEDYEYAKIHQIMWAKFFMGMRMIDCFLLKGGCQLRLAGSKKARTPQDRKGLDNSATNKLQLIPPVQNL